MNRKDREQIDHCCESIMSKIDLTKLLPKLLENKVYNRDDVNIPRWSKNLGAQSTVKDILLTIKTRGPNAFKNLILSLRQSNHEDVADILEKQNNASSNTKQENPLDHHIFSDEPLTIEVCKATKFLDCEYDVIERYPMRSKPRGLVLIITNIYYESSYENPRFSAKHDNNNLKKLFEEMGFTVDTYQNLTGQAMKDTIKEFSKRDDLNKVDSCFVIVTSHGMEDEESNTEIQGTDYHIASRQANYEKVLCTEVCDYFTAEACPQLAEKPKIFIFQLCRGKKKQKGVIHSRITTDSCAMKSTNEANIEIPHIQTIRNYSDMLIVQSTLPGYVSYRDSKTGSWFIQILCKIFMNHAHQNHVQDLFNMIDAELKNLRTTNYECQTSSVQSLGFNKHCYLNPGLFMES
ncbi:Caspase Nc [Trachymyrmex zeteki]|uniref:Caspase Nc n=2 Tax=Mycetomoellerius zeteki TaxID=64791 RepID=A0A151WGN2_9HYME|nr:PREDICTED: caspase Dronc isoform X2 [Trachymyrmex zeteki]XP_018315351.1 PREDICTED: caspase Dronc isoform X2 [Trachymyrmex zeteki]XP_018315352.1 PREDICTED: caspase Dronc isoform X2 [Trachymyrmex zeteki]KYQ46999.1 Caspase Nc [Trachymyrmex zeteki]